MMENKEEILVFPRKCVHRYDRFLPWSEARSIITCAERNFEWLPRSKAENFEDWVQPIPCALVRDRSDSYCVLRRIRQTSIELRARISLLAGGHVHRIPNFKSFESLLLMTLRRELDEEIGVQEVTLFRQVGLVIDSVSINSSRHIAFVYEIDSSRTLTIRAHEEFSSRSKFSGNFFTPVDLKRFHKQFDPWSLVIFEDYIGSMYSKRTARQIELPSILDG